MDNVEVNKAIVRKAYECLGQEPHSDFFNLLTDDIEWSFTGTHVFTGIFKGKDDITTRLFGPMAKTVVSSKFRIDNMIAEGDQVVVEGVGHAPTTDGRVYNNNYCLVVTVRDERISRIREYLDTEMVTAFFGYTVREKVSS